MNIIAKTKRAFTLVEVAIAIGVVAIAIPGIVGLFGTAFTAVNDIANQGEAIGVVQTLPAYLQSKGFDAIYDCIKTGASNNIYAYAANGTVVMDTNDAPNMLPTAIVQRNGRIFNVVLSLSTNAPMVLTTGTGTAPAYFASGVSASTLPDKGSYGDSYLPVNVKIYSVSQVPAPPAMTQTLPVLNYDTVLFR